MFAVNNSECTMQSEAPATHAKSAGIRLIPDSIFRTNYQVHVTLWCTESLCLLLHIDHIANRLGMLDFVVSS